MGNIKGTVIVIYDNYNNVLIIQRGKKSSEGWSLVGKDLKGKETPEKCISKGAEKDLDCTIFDLKELGEYNIDGNGEASVLAYSGMIRQTIVPHKTIGGAKWISKKDLDSYEFTEGVKKILEDFFASR